MHYHFFCFVPDVGGGKRVVTHCVVVKGKEQAHLVEDWRQGGVRLSVIITHPATITNNHFYDHRHRHHFRSLSHNRLDEKKKNTHAHTHTCKR